MNKPVIASVHGVAAANGGSLVVAADLAIASDKARIGYTAVTVGLFCLGPAVPLSRVVGRKKALKLLLYGKLITAQKAPKRGLVNQVMAPRTWIRRPGAGPRAWPKRAPWLCRSTRRPSTP
ncbi:hypothetical protein DFAR_4000014 [Desulfarculales bacterium]